MKIGFHANQLSERGCELALYDYCKFSRLFLGFEPVVFYGKNNPANDLSVIRRFEEEFDVFAYDHFSTVDDQISKRSIDLFYAIKGGEVDHIYSKRVPTMVHAVFAQSPLEVHGSAYAFISEWLSRKCSACLIPAVPFIVHQACSPDPLALRVALGIPRSATVFACYGGSGSFDLSFVSQISMPAVLSKRPDVHFLFMNIRPFINHPRVHFLPRSTDLRYKESFVAASDAMLHARRQGESFGLACAEFSAQSKPIFAYRFTPDRHPQFILRDAIQLYSGPDDLLSKLLAFSRDSIPPVGVDAYLRRYSPEIVMEAFDRHLIQPSIKIGGFGVILTVFTQPLRRPLSPVARSFFWQLQILLRRASRLFGGLINRSLSN